MGEVSMTAEASGSGSVNLPSHTAPTILSTLHNLLLSSSPIPAPLNHPYSPSPVYGSWKGKSRENSSAVSVNEQRQLLEQLRDGVEAAKAVLGRAAKEEGRSKLARAMKDVTMHQSALLPILPSITPLGRRPPSYRTPPKPMELLTSISERLGIDTFLEESQFGLLKTTLAIAGKKFVLDVELEVDSTSLGDETPMPTPAPTPASAPAPAPAPAPGAEVEGNEARGKVRLAKLALNHVTANGETADSVSIATAIREGLEAYLQVWNDESGLPESYEAVVKRLWEDMSDLAALDVLSEQESKDWIAGLELKATTVAGLNQGGHIHSSSPSVLPRFSLLAGDTTCQFRLRPSPASEHVPCPFMDDGTKSDWVLEYVPDVMAGMVARRNWLQLSADYGDSAEEGIRVEQLLCPTSDAPNGFPYNAELAHATATKVTQGLEQYWSVVQPGPVGYLVGRVGWSDDQNAVEQLLAALKRQAILNGMITRVLDATKLSPVSTTIDLHDDDESEEVDFDVLSKAPIALPITLTLLNHGLQAVMPLPYAADSHSRLTLTFSLGDDDSAGSQLDWTVTHEIDSETRSRVESAIDGARAVAADPVEAVRRIEQALK